MGGQFLILWSKRKGCSPSFAWGRLCFSHPWPLWQMNWGHRGNLGWWNCRRIWIPADKNDVGSSTLFLPADGAGLAWEEGAAGGPSASKHACPSPRRSFSGPAPALEGSHLSCRMPFCFPLPARGSVPKLPWDEGKPFPGLPPHTSACRNLSTARRADECESVYPCISTGTCMSMLTCPQTCTHTFLFGCGLLWAVEIFYIPEFTFHFSWTGSAPLPVVAS